MTPDKSTIQEIMLPVGDGHELYVHEWGSKRAKRTFLFLHGGPGGGCNDKMKRVFDANRDHVIFFDQRGAGRSTPAGSIDANTTEHLMQDIETILAKFGLMRVVVVGGSWGSTLALAYALKHPERVQALVLRGIFTSSQPELDHLLKGKFRNFFPDVWETLLTRTPKEHHDDPVAYHLPRAVSNDGNSAKASCYALSEMEGTISIRDDRHTPEDYAAFNPVPARIEAHYLLHNLFVEPHYILGNAHKLTMPVWIVHGRYDFVCPAVTAYELHKRLPNGSLILTESGHSLNERGNSDATRAIISALTV